MTPIFLIFFFYLKDLFTSGLLPHDCSGLGWVKLKPGASSRSLLQEAETQTLGHLPLLSQAIIRELDHKWSCWDLSQCQYELPVLADSGFIGYATMLAPVIFLIKGFLNGVSCPIIPFWNLFPSYKVIYFRSLKS